MRGTEVSTNREARPLIGRHLGHLPLVVFSVVVVGALPLYLVHGHSQWFYLDEWDFLADRDLKSLDDLFRPHNEHWSTIPIVVYRVLFRLFGLRTYVPYQTTLIVTHLAVGVLLRVVMRRAGMDAWLATAAAALFVLFGSANQNIVWAFQIGFVGSLAFGLVHLLLADHDGATDRRDMAGLVAGAASLLCSGVGVAMVGVVGLAVLLRRGWRAAVVHVAPLALLFAIWWLVAGRDSYDAADPDPNAMFGFVRTGYANVFEELGQSAFVGVVLAAVLVVGSVIMVRSSSFDEWRLRASAPVALFAGGLFFLMSSGFGRAAAFGSEAARAGRYLHIVGALCLPAIALAADAIARRRRWALPVLVALLLVGIPGNIDALDARDEGRARFGLGAPQLMLLFPRLDIATDVPRSARPAPESAPEVTMGWLLDGVASGRVPRPESTTPANLGAATIRVALQQTSERAPEGNCQVVDGPVDMSITKGDLLGLRGGGVRIGLEGTGGGQTYDTARGHAVRVLAGTLDVRLTSVDPNDAAVVCTGT